MFDYYLCLFLSPFYFPQKNTSPIIWRYHFGFIPCVYIYKYLCDRYLFGSWCAWDSQNPLWSEDTPWLIYCNLTSLNTERWKKHLRPHWIKGVKVRIWFTRTRKWHHLRPIKWVKVVIEIQGTKPKHGSMYASFCESYYFEMRTTGI